jgi:hypothetical protein
VVAYDSLQDDFEDGAAAVDAAAGGGAIEIAGAIEDQVAGWQIAVVAGGGDEFVQDGLGPAAA